MSEFRLAHLHVGTYKKVEKLNEQMKKELQKAAKAKAKEVRARITNDKVSFKGKPEQIVLAEIDNKRKNKEQKIIIVATKLDAKKKGHIFALKFDNDEEFDKFWEDLAKRADKTVPEKTEAQSGGEPSRGTTTEGTEELAQKPLPSTSVAPTTEQPQTRVSRLNRSRGSITSVNSSVPKQNYSEYQNIPQSGSSGKAQSNIRPPSSDSTTIQRPPTKQNRTPQSTLQDGLATPSSLSTLATQNHISYNTEPISTKSYSTATLSTKAAVTSTYVSTDVLNSRKQSRSSKSKNGKIPAKEFYMIKKKSNEKGDNFGAEVRYLKYIPGKGIVQIKKPNSSRNSSQSSASSSPPTTTTTTSRSSSSSSSSSSQSTKKGRKSQLYKLVPVNESRNSSSSSSSNTSDSGIRKRKARSESFSSLASSKSASIHKVNVWKNSNLRPSWRSRSSLSPSSAASMSGSFEYIECPLCRHRSKSRTRVH